MLLVRATPCRPPSVASGAGRRPSVRAHWRLPNFFGGDAGSAADGGEGADASARQARAAAAADAETVANALRHHQREREQRRRRDRLHQHGARAPAASPSDADPAGAASWGPAHQHSSAAAGDGAFGGGMFDGDEDGDDEDGGALGGQDGEGAPLDFYGILGVSPFADGREIRAAYLRAVRSCHPDLARSPAPAAAADGGNGSSSGVNSSGGSSSDGSTSSREEEEEAARDRHAAATHLSALLNEIYATLADPDARGHYDALAGFGAFGGGSGAGGGRPLAASNPFSRAVSGVPPVAGDVPAAVGQALEGAVNGHEAALTAHDHVIVDEIACVGCGKCVLVCPSVFEIEGSKYGRARVIGGLQPLLGPAARVASAGEGAACSVSAHAAGSPFFGGEGSGGQTGGFQEAPAAGSGGGDAEAGHDDACARLLGAADAVDVARLACPADCIHLVTAAQHALLAEQLARLPRVDAFLMLRSSSRPTADLFVESERLWRRRRGAAEAARREAKEGWAAGAAAGASSSSSASSARQQQPAPSSPFAEWFASAARSVDWDPRHDGMPPPGSGGGGGEGNGGGVRPRDAGKLATLAASAARAAADWRERERSARGARRRVVGVLSDGGAAAAGGEEEEQVVSSR